MKENPEKPLKATWLANSRALCECGMDTVNQDKFIDGPVKWFQDEVQAGRGRRAVCWLNRMFEHLKEHGVETEEEGVETQTHYPAAEIALWLVLQSEVNKAWPSILKERNS